MASKTDFLKAYVSLEKVLKEKNMTVLDYEGKLKEKDASKLKICRLCRNFMVHEDSDFIQPSSKQIDFVSNLTFSLSTGEKPASKVMTPVAKALTPDSTIGEAILSCKKKSPLSSGKIAIFSKKGFEGILDGDSLMAAIIGGKTIGIKNETPVKKILPYLRKDIKSVSKNTALREIKEISLVTDGITVVGYVS